MSQTRTLLQPPVKPFWLFIYFVLINSNQNSSSNDQVMFVRINIFSLLFLFINTLSTLVLQINAMRILLLIFITNGSFVSLLSVFQIYEKNIFW